MQGKSVRPKLNAENFVGQRPNFSSTQKIDAFHRKSCFLACPSSGRGRSQASTKPPTLAKPSPHQPGSRARSQPDTLSQRHNKTSTAPATPTTHTLTSITSYVGHVINQLINQSINQSINLSISQSIKNLKLLQVLDQSRSSYAGIRALLKRAGNVTIARGWSHFSFATRI
jgi:hypothetical protein